MFFYYFSSFISFGFPSLLFHILYRLLFCFCFAIVPFCQLLLRITLLVFFQFHKSFPQFYFTVRFPIFFYFSVVLPLVFAISWFIRLNSIFCQCTYDFCLLSFRVFTFLHVSFQFWFIIFCSFNGGMSSFCRDFLGFCKKRFLIKIIQFSTCFCFILAVACLKTLFI